MAGLLRLLGTLRRGVHSVVQQKPSSQPSWVLAAPWHSSGHGLALPANLSRAVSSHAAAQQDDPMVELTSSLLDDSQRRALTPSAIVQMLDRFIVGQPAAKRAVAIAMRNRWRRHKVPSPACEEIMPKNILMVGPTGVGKTEIARRLAKLADAPFLKVEATKYTELGFVGRDVEDIVKDLVEHSMLLTKQLLKEKLAVISRQKAEDKILEALCGENADRSTVETFRPFYRTGVLDERLVDLDLGPAIPGTSSSSSGPQGMDGAFIVLESVFNDSKKGKRGADKRKYKVSEAKSLLEEMESERYLQSDFVAREAIKSAEQDGIVFIDEIDKIVEGPGRYIGGNVSSEGVQRDLLPIIEGCTVSTKYGQVSTDHMLFICSGAFHSSKPSDMLAELQGRLPIRVELSGLTASDMFKILTEPENNMLKQQKVLLATEGVELQFTDGAIHATAEAAEEANRLLDNIGARRLHTVLERILAEVSFDAPELAAKARASGLERFTYVVDQERVTACMSDLLKKQDLSRYVL